MFVSQLCLCGICCRGIFRVFCFDCSSGFWRITMLCDMVMVPRKKKTGGVPVYLNVYDLTPMNGYAYWVGLGIYHSGVQVHGVEYGFGAHDHSSTGIFEVEPRQCPGFTFRKSILIGRTDLGPKEVRSFMEGLSVEYSGNTYHLITKNCNHFCNNVCVKLTGKTIPRWVNRLARLGFFCNCVLPAELNETKIRAVRSDNNLQPSDKKKFRSLSSRFLSTSSSTSSPSLLSFNTRSSSQSSRKSCHIRPSFVANTPTTTLSLKL